MVDGRYEVWVFKVGEEFGYVVGKMIYESDGAQRRGNADDRSTILRKVSASPLAWLRGVQHWVELDGALSKRQRALRVTQYELYRADVMTVPACFKSLLSWLWWRDTERSSRSPYCSDCSHEFQAKMIREDKCGHPELDLSDHDAVCEVVVAAPTSKRGRPRLEASL